MIIMLPPPALISNTNKKSHDFTHQSCQHRNSQLAQHEECAVTSGFNDSQIYNNVMNNINNERSLSDSYEHVHHQDTSMSFYRSQEYTNNLGNRSIYDSGTYNTGSHITDVSSVDNPNRQQNSSYLNTQHSISTNSKLDSINNKLKNKTFNHVNTHCIAENDSILENNSIMNGSISLKKSSHNQCNHTERNTKIQNTNKQIQIGPSTHFNNFQNPNLGRHNPNRDSVSLYEDMLQFSHVSPETNAYSRSSRNADTYSTSPFHIQGEESLWKNTPTSSHKPKSTIKKNEKSGFVSLPYEDMTCTHAQPESNAVKKSRAKSSYKHVPHKDKPPHLVARRNARERRRVQAVNTAFGRLRKHIPYPNKNKRLSKVKTLKIAIDYIHELQDLIEDYDSLHGHMYRSGESVYREDNSAEIGGYGKDGYGKVNGYEKDLYRKDGGAYDRHSGIGWNGNQQTYHSDIEDYRFSRPVQ